MKKFFILVVLVTFGVGCLVAGMGYFFRPVVEEYGVTTVQYDEKTGTYFAEVTSRYELEPTAEMKAGMPISYYKTKGTVLKVSSKLESKGDVQVRAYEETILGYSIGGVIVWGVAVVCFLGDYWQERRRNARLAELDKKD